MADIINIDSVVEQLTISDPETALDISITEESLNVGAVVDVVSVVSNDDVINISTDEISLTVSSVIEELPLVDSPTIIQVVEDGQMPYAKRTDFVDASNLIYRGEATVGSAESASVWRIRRLTIDVNSDDDVTEEWQDGNANFDNVWDDRAAGSYS